MEQKICQDCLFFKYNKNRRGLCEKQHNYYIDMLDHCPLGITIEDIERIDKLCLQDVKNGIFNL